MKECKQRGAVGNPFSAAGDHVGEERQGGISNLEFRRAVEYGDVRIVQRALKSKAIYNIEHQVR